MPSNAATTSHFPWTKLATFWKVSKYHKRKKSQQHLSFMEKHFNNSLLQLTFAVNQDFMSESIIPSTAGQLGINSICFHGTQWDGHKETNARPTESWLRGCLPKQAAPGSPAPCGIRCSKRGPHYLQTASKRGPEFFFKCFSYWTGRD